MEGKSQVYHVKLDSARRLLILSEAWERRHMSTGHTMVVVEDEFGLHVKTRAELLAEARAYFAKLAPPGILLSDKINEDRRAEHERH